ncbi:MAG: hypothetical protein ACMUJM_15045 [bacterium]
MIKKYLFLFVALLLITWAWDSATQSIAGASGLAVSPGGLLIQNVKPGEPYNITEVSGVTLNISNKDSIPHTYVITTHKPSTVAAGKWIKGYLEIPDPSWFKLEKNEISIKAHQTEKIKMYIEIPDDERYYNQSWSVALLVKGKTGPGQSVALAVAPRYEIETIGKTGLTITPDGIVSLEPHLIILENFIPGKKKKATVMLYNNDDKKHTYKISPMIFAQDTGKSMISLSPGYSWIPDVKWIKPKKSVLKVGPGEKGLISFSVKIPKDQNNFNRKWEVILFCEPDKGPSRFMRVHVDTKKSQLDL